jgi:sensitive to high expression protein 9
VNELLQRKHAWSPIDLERFTELYRSDHANEQNESAAQERLALAERTADEAQAELARSILARYHEEQIWSDKIRRASTWGTWGLMGFNVLLFIIVQLGLEPWKRKRLVGGFEEKVREVIQEESLKNALLHAQHIAGEEQSAIQPGAEILETAITSSSSDVRDMPEFAAIEQPVAISESQKEHTTNINAGEGVSGSKQTILNETQKSLKFVKEKAQELMSERKIMVSQKELTIVAAQSAAVGAVLTALVSIVISSR